MVGKNKVEGIKSALEIAMERLEKESGGSSRITEDQKEKISEVEKDLQAKIAEIEIMSGQKIEEAAGRGELDEAAELRARMQDEVARLRRKAERKKELIRRGEE